MDEAVPRVPDIVNKSRFHMIQYLYRKNILCFDIFVAELSMGGGIKY